MQAKSVALLSLAGMLLTSVSVYSLTPPGVEVAAVNESVAVRSGSGTEATDATSASTFSAGNTLLVEGRVGHPRMVTSPRGETFLMLEVRGSDRATATTAAPVNLSLVIDRSGSMRGTRLTNAINAAIVAVDRLRDGDVVSVLAFDTRSAVIVSPTTIGPGTRERIAADIRRITLGGDTCISCGIEDGLAELDRTTGKVNRMVVLSDGQATAGIRDEPGFRSLAQRAQARGVTVTTIGVDVDYNERILAAIAQEANGQHYFVENDASLARVFQAEADALTSTIASGAEATIELAPGVELERVLGRSFRRVGRGVVVPLGTFTRGEVKTVLVKVNVAANRTGDMPLADVSLAFRDLGTGTDARCEGRLAAQVVANRLDASELDGVVATRVERSETAQVLQSANQLFASGRGDEARRKLDERASRLRSSSADIASKAPREKAKDLGADLEKQIAAIDDANTGFASPPANAGPVAGAPASPAPPPQASRPGKVAGKRSLESANAFDR